MRQKIEMPTNDNFKIYQKTQWHTFKNWSKKDTSISHQQSAVQGALKMESILRKNWKCAVSMFDYLVILVLLNAKDRRF